MAIQLPQGFKVGSVEPIDSRITLTKAEMLSMNDNIMPDVYFAVCKNDGKMYIYNKNNEADPETGKFRLQDVEITPSKIAGELPEALKEVLSKQSADSGLAVDEDGNIKVQLNEEHLQIIDNQIDLAVSMIQAIESN